MIIVCTFIKKTLTFGHSYLMKFQTNTTTNFDKQARKIAKKYISLMDDIIHLRDALSINPFQGDGLGKDFYKIRLAITSKGKGKSGGARVITLVKVVDKLVILVAIYDKSAMDTITDKELKNIIK